MTPKFEQLKKISTDIADYKQAIAVLGWDQQVNMPPNGAEGRGAVIASLEQHAHDAFVSEETQRVLEDVEKEAKDWDPESDDARLVKSFRRWVDRSKKVSSDWVAEFYKMVVVGNSKWEEAKEKNDFDMFQPYLEKIVDLRKQFSDFFKPYDHVYDPLLDEFEPNLKTREVQEIFAILRPRQVELLKVIASKPQVNDAFMHLKYPEKDQWEFGVEVISKFGYDWKSGRQDKSVHPFTQGMNPGDVRITTRVNENMMQTALFGTMHECGHALYEMGISRKYDRSLLGMTVSLALHESQSRMWENLVGRSLNFWKHFFPIVQKRFPSQLGNLDLMTFYKGINKVEPSLIRVEADEATYNLHIMLRLEIEIALMEGSLKVKDLPDYWNTKFMEYMGLTPPNHSKGVLQDVHWSNGYFGYFPTYALGNLISVQIWEKIMQDIPDLEEQITRGEFSNLLGWLREKVHRHGAKYEPQELVLKVTGSKIDPQPYLRYLEKKYKEIYGI